ncbi:Orn/Lys/Arg family decarboxylase [Gulosibacter molinativorax]|uniref:Lysine decarboxylase n=1 Tax=Gulosibacter molinativorax TaxID=256821 RepID=A0ABT7C9Z1_9MICO|nr:Orn/Lys/Arg decarboxylase N-terminal domain-containing protein [Gulosibacter molinativorax]MDJ1371562.1 lysine decarboxylase [Gulosibacter molinativorax]QUY61095.1 Lysine decarboxylase [Gulosibacter molinativorax]
MKNTGFSIAVLTDRRDDALRLRHPIDDLLPELEQRGANVETLQRTGHAGSYGRVFTDSSTIIYHVDQAALDDEAANDGSEALQRFVREVRAENAEIPVYLYGEQLTARRIPDDVLGEVAGVINAFEDTPSFVARLIQREANRYVERLAPPFFRALMHYANDGAYSWHTPGHSGGTAFLKSPVGTLFHDFFGENMLQADVCNAVEELGQLLDHTGPVAESEARAAETFGADHLYFVTNGTSTSNKIVWNSAVAPGDVVIVDRNCHKSILHAIMLTGAIPIYLKPTRNRAGIIGPIARAEFSPESIRDKIAAHPFIDDPDVTPRILTLTQSTYDGIVYNAEEIKRTLDGAIEVMHFDEAWLPHARFHELYRGMHAVDERLPRTTESLVYSTQSTHKLLAGLSQASQILVQNAENRQLDPNIFNEAYLMHTSTSPQYSIVASCDVSAEMMRGVGGHALVEETIMEAMEFRRAIIRIAEETENDDWWFSVWGPDTPAREGLADRAEWELTNDQHWHGFEHVDEGFTMLDPIKVTLMTPGLDTDGTFDRTGIPGLVLTKYLAEHDIVVEKTGLYSLFVLFTIGITKGRWNTLIAELHRFKRAYDRDAPLREVMPEFVAVHPLYNNFGLRELCDALHGAYRAGDFANLTTDVYLDEPEVAMLPSDAWAAMTTGRIEHVSLDELAGRITAVLLTPYPPGIPLLVPGERVTEGIVNYLRTEAELATRFPGFKGITHGLGTGEDGRITVACVRES